MCLLNFVLFFKLNYKCNYGEAVYVVGNIKQLGSWNPAGALKLQWTEGHNWTQKLKLTHDNTKLIEYKYFIAPDNVAPVSNVIRWETGSSHYLNLLTVSTLLVKLNDEWEHIKIKLVLHCDAVKKNFTGTGKKVVLQTNLDPAQNKFEMKLERSAVNGGIKEDWFWTTSFALPNCITSFRYKYKIEGENAEEVVGDRGGRKFSVKKFLDPSCFDKIHSIMGCTLIKSDFDLKTSLNYSPVTEDILVGAFPQNSKDINDIAALDVKGVLNLQTFEDMERLGTDWESLKSSYKEANITVEHFPISDMNIEDLSLKMKDAADLLDKLLKNGKVYVHCTAGRFRSPNIIIYYLACYKNYTPKQAIGLMMSKRSEARIVKGIFSEKCEESIKSNN